MNNREISAYAIVVLLLFVILPTIYYDIGYRAGAKGTSEEPTPLRIMTGVVSLNTTTYNMSWYDMGFGDPEQQPIPTLRNDSFLMYVNVYWGESDIRASHDDRIPHVTITTAILPFEHSTYNLTIERVAVCWRSLIEGQHIDNFYDNSKIEISSVDGVGIVLFGYGSYQSNMDVWVTRYMVFTAGPIWYEEVPVDLS